MGGVDAPEGEVGLLWLGQTEQVFANGGPAAGLPGKITYISEVADDAANTTRVEISVDNNPRILRSGQIVRVRLRRGEGVLENVIMLPLETIIPLEEGKVGYVVDEHGRALRRKVEVDLRRIRGSSVPVRGELAEGDRLIVAGHRLVAPGKPVRIIPDQPTSQVAE